MTPEVFFFAGKSTLPDGLVAREFPVEPRPAPFRPDEDGGPVMDPASVRSSPGVSEKE